MSKIRLINLQTIFDRFIFNHSNDVYIAFNPFFSLASPALFERENGIIIRDKYYQQRNGAILFHAIVWFFRNVYSLIKVKLQRCIKMFKDVFNAPILYGNIKQGTKILFVTWMNQRDFQLFSGSYKDRFWGDLFKSCEQKGQGWQVLIFPLYKLDNNEVAKYLSDNKIMLCVNDKISLGYYLKIIWHGFKLLPDMFHYRYPKKWVALYISSLFNQRACQSLALYLELKRLADIPIDLKVIMPWEGQPEQKAICKRFRENGNNVYGYIHSSLGDVPFQYLKTKFDDTFYPNKYYMHSKDTMTVLADLGYKKASMEIVKPVRFKEQDAHSFNGKCYLPFNHEDAIKYIQIANELVSIGLFKVKEMCVHPSASVSNKMKMAIVKFPYVEASADVIVVGFSAVIFEALEAGCVVYQIVEDGPGEIVEEFYPSIDREKIHDKCFKLSLKPSHNYSLLAFDSMKTISDFLQ